VPIQLTELLVEFDIAASNKQSILFGQTEAEAGDWEKRRREAEAWSKSYEPPLPEQVSEPGRSM
jgi:hypothetical protein